MEHLENLFVKAAMIECNIYGTFRMVKEVTEYKEGTDLDQISARGIKDNGVYREEYFFEDLTSGDWDQLELWSSLEEDQVKLSQIFESLDREGIGFAPSEWLEENEQSRSMTWFYSDFERETLNNSSNIADSIAFLRDYEPSSQFEASVVAAALSTFEKSACSHSWEGDSQEWECLACGVRSWLDDID